ncbi:tripartite tricarboxylate transporter substrate binding protein [Candidimonas humi]|uniref:Bug family tripartite tricarboxylate transporter substrate binding protein n=1 Tax=Candidimonas humi TaxID=683355 RepID=A0ABV8P3M9_9BURK|nr:tripartite tricarboxylate transporter substrate binding protein [Candidimonas humi]MBV6305380.1 tripartite tricarboxylate transporter substrate binding protein [Candidimonas humi]
MKFHRSIAAGVLGCLASVGVACAASPAANYPDHPIKLVVGYAPGGGNDISARLLAKAISPILHESIVVENRPGAGTNIAASYVARSAPDGYTLSLSSTALAINVSLYPHLDYDAVKDFEPVALFAEAPDLLVVNPKLGINSVHDLIAYGKAHPGKLNFSSAGIGSTQHLAGELFKLKGGFEATHVPYKGSAPALAAVIGGQAAFSFLNIPSAKQLVESGKVKALAITAAKRFPAVPNVPTMAQQGIKGMEVATWYSIVAPAGTPRAIVDKLNKAINKAMEEPDLRKHFVDLGMAPITESPEYFKKYLASEIARWREIVKQSHATVN